jgi:hypothetical protein
VNSIKTKKLLSFHTIITTIIVNIMMDISICKGIPAVKQAEVP